MNHRSGRARQACETQNFNESFFVIYAARSPRKIRGFVADDSFREFFIENEYVECAKLSQFMYEIR